MPRWSIDRNKRLLDKGIEAIKKERSNWDIEAQNEILSLYTIVVAALAFAFDKNEAILFWFHLLQ